MLEGAVKHSENPLVDRRVRKLRRLWWHLQEDVGLLLWILIGLFLSGLLWLALDGILRLWR